LADKLLDSLGLVDNRHEHNALILTYELNNGGLSLASKSADFWAASEEQAACDSLLDGVRFSILPGLELKLKLIVINSKCILNLNEVILLTVAT